MQSYTNFKFVYNCIIYSLHYILLSYVHILSLLILYLILHFVLMCCVLQI